MLLECLFLFPLACLCVIACLYVYCSLVFIGISLSNYVFLFMPWWWTLPSGCPPDSSSWAKFTLRAPIQNAFHWLAPHSNFKWHGIEFVCSSDLKPQMLLLHLFGYSTTSRLNGKYLLNKTWHRQSCKGIGKYKGYPTLSQISWTLVHK